MIVTSMAFAANWHFHSTAEFHGKNQNSPEWHIILPAVEKEKENSDSKPGQMELA